MEKNKEKRKSARCHYEPPLTYQLTMFDRAFHARGADVSDDGISFKSSDKINPGTIIFLKHRDCSQCGCDDENCKRCRTATFATVKWCKEFNRIDSHYFHIGAKYLVPNDVSFY